MSHADDLAILRRALDLPSVDFARLSTSLRTLVLSYCDRKTSSASKDDTRTVLLLATRLSSTKDALDLPSVIRLATAYGRTNRQALNAIIDNVIGHTPTALDDLIPGFLAALARPRATVCPPISPAFVHTHTS